MERSIPVEFALLLGGSFKKKNGGVAPAIILIVLIPVEEFCQEIQCHNQR